MFPLSSAIFRSLILVALCSSGRKLFYVGLINYFSTSSELYLVSTQNKTLGTSFLEPLIVLVGCVSCLLRPGRTWPGDNSSQQIVYFGSVVKLNSLQPKSRAINT